MAAVLGWIAVVVVAGTSTGLLLSRDWRWDLGLLAAQYVGVAALVAQHLPIGMAAAKLVAGWMAIAALGMTFMGLPQSEVISEPLLRQGRTFRLFMAGMVCVMAAAVTPRVENSMAGVGAPVITGAIVLIGMGLLHLGTRPETARVVFGLLTVLGGFEAFYAAIEGSILVAGLLAAVNLGLGLTGAYLLTVASPEEVL